MPIDFTCPRCDAPLSVPEEYAGQHGPCPRCEATVTIPMTSAPTPVAVGGPTAGPTSSRWLVIVTLLLPIVFLVVLAFVGVGVALLWPAINASRDAARQVECRGNLQKIGTALEAYHTEHGCYPPAYLADEDGTPMHSWRVLILPYLGDDEKKLYSQYDFDEPWDSQDNQFLQYQMPDVYGCPSDTYNFGGETSYMMLIGPETISGGAGTTCKEEITDDKDRTILLVETSGGIVQWLEPADLDTTGLSFQVNDPTADGIQSLHSGGANVLFVDGSVGLLPDSISPVDVEGLSTIGGNEEIDDIYLDF